MDFGRRYRKFQGIKKQPSFFCFSQSKLSRVEINGGRLTLTGAFFVFV
jgi:hypothetical protein